MLKVSEGTRRTVDTLTATEIHRLRAQNDARTPSLRREDRPQILSIVSRAAAGKRQADGGIVSLVRVGWDRTKLLAQSEVIPTIEPRDKNTIT
jgi:hypothetical protein